MPIINPVGEENIIANDNFQNVENDEEIINNSNNPDVNNEVEESEIGQRAKIENGMDVEQNTDENEYVTRKEFNALKDEIFERMDQRFDEVMKKLDKKSDK